MKQTTSKTFTIFGWFLVKIALLTAFVMAFRYLCGTKGDTLDSIWIIPLGIGYYNSWRCLSRELRRLHTIDSNK